MFVFVATIRGVRSGRATLEVEYWINPLYDVSFGILTYRDFIIYFPSVGFQLFNY